MTNLLTHDECRAIAATLQLRVNALVDGGLRPAFSGKNGIIIGGDISGNAFVEPTNMEVD